MKNFALLLILLFPLLSTTSSSEAKPTKSFSVDLIHVDSPLSPTYDSSMTPSELLQNAAFRSISRFSNFHHIPNNIAYNGSKVQTTINPSAGDYLMKIFIGTPPVESLVIADTATDLSWIQCQPCWECYPQNAPIFDPKNSPTYKLQDCFSDACEFLFIHVCGDSNDCKYSEKYGDSSQSIGELASDTISFDGTTSTSYPNFLFGCGHYNVGRFKSAGSGLAGLGRGRVSLISQLGYQIGLKFSYCLNSPYSGGSTTSKLKFGGDSIISNEALVTVPLAIGIYQATAYNLNLEGISVGGSKVEPDHQSIMLVDAATTLTMLESSFYLKVLSAVLTYIGRPSVLVPPKPYNLCYDEGTGKFPYPNITIHFGGANGGLQLQKYHTFGRVRNLICLLIIPSNGYSILGNMAQVDFEVQYDLQGHKVSFAPADCSKE